MIDPVSAVSGQGLLQPTKIGGADQADFFKVLESQFQEVDQKIKVADNSLRELAVGESDNLHQVMIALSQAKTSFDLMVQIRNRAVEGLQEMLRMSI